MPSLIFAGDKINAGIEKGAERKRVCTSLLWAICVFEFASMHVHVCIHKFMFARRIPYATEMLLHLSVCMCTFMYACASLCTELFDCLCAFRHVCSSVFTWLLMMSSSWWTCRTYPELQEMVQRSPL